MLSPLRQRYSCSKAARPRGAFIFFLVLLLPWLSACRKDDVRLINPGLDLSILPDPIHRSFKIEEVRNSIDWLPLNRHPNPALEHVLGAWLRLDLPDLSSYEHPSLLLGLCLNIDQIHDQDQKLLDHQLDPSGHLTPQRLRVPYLPLGKMSGQRLWIHVVPSQRTGLHPDCRELAIGGEMAVVRRFTEFQALDITTGMIVLFLGLVGCGLALVGRRLVYFYFGSFASSLALAYLLTSHPILYYYWQTEWLFDFWHFAIMLIPVSFCLFFQETLPKKNRFFEITSYGLLLMIVGSTYYFIREDWEGLETYRLIYLAFSFPLAIAVVVRSLRDSFGSSQASKHVLGVGLFAFLFSAALDLAFYLSDFPIYMVSCWGILLLMTFMLIFLVQFFIEKEQTLEREKRRGLEADTQKLEELVKSRTIHLNEKTRQLQLSNSELSDKNILMALSFKRLEELIFQKDALLKQAATIGKKQLPRLDLALKQLFEGGLRPQLQTASVEAHTLASQLEPFALLYEDVRAVQNKMVWLLEPSPQFMALIRTALGGSKVSVRSFQSPDEFLQALQLQSPDLALINASYRDLPAVMVRDFPETEVMLCTRDNFVEHLAFLQSQPAICHLLFLDSQDRSFMQKNVLVSTTKLLSNDIFGIEKYLNWGVDIKEHIVTGSSTRDEINEQLAQHLTRSGVQSSHIKTAALICEELLMNAVYDAAVDRATGKSKYNHLSRTQTVELEPSEFGKLRYAFDGQLIAISVEDPFGGLTRDIVLKYLRSCFAGQYGKINEVEGKGGGGMGFFQILSTADLLVANLRPRQKTEILALINVNHKSHVRQTGGCFQFFIER